MKFRTILSLFLGLFIAGIAVAFQFGSEDVKLKPLDVNTLSVMYQPPKNSVEGNPNGKVTLVEFFDYNCHFCRQAAPKIKKLMAENPDLRVVYKELLLFGAPSVPATEAALAARKQGKYLVLHDAFLNANSPLTEEKVLEIAKTAGLNVPKLQADMKSPNVQTQIAQNGQLFRNLGFIAAPVFVVTRSDISVDAQTNVPQYVLNGVKGLDKAVARSLGQSQQ